MKRTFNIILMSFVGLFLVGCASAPQPKMTQLQLRELQTRTFETADAKLVMKAMLNVLQDDGFVVKNAVMDLGLLSATKEVDLEDKRQSGWVKFFAGDEAVYTKNMEMEASANVTILGKQAQVRVNFQKKVYNNKGAVEKIESIQDAEYYQDFFSKVSKAIFIQSEGI